MLDAGPPTRSTTSASAAVRSSGADTVTRGEICAVSTWVVSKPGAIRISAMKLPMKSAAPTSSTTASDTSATTRPLRRR